MKMFSDIGEENRAKLHVVISGSLWRKQKLVERYVCDSSTISSDIDWIGRNPGLIDTQQTRGSNGLPDISRNNYWSHFATLTSMFLSLFGVHDTGYEKFDSDKYNTYV